MRSLLMIVVLACVGMICQGCAHIPLRNNTLRQARTLSEVFENQVLDNIAQTIAAPNTTPYFSYPNGGSVEVEQGASTDGGLTWDPSSLSEVALNAMGSGALREVWSVTPVANPDRLELMHCLLAHVTGRAESDPCIQCDNRLSIFFGSKYPDCLPQCFYHCGKKRDVPKNCVKVGHYEDVYVWVTPNHYAALRTITLAMLDIATADLSKFSAADNKTIKIHETRKKDGVDITAEYYVSPEEYTTLFPDSSVQAAPNVGGFKAFAPMNEQPFRARIDERNPIRDSILSLPRN